MHKDKGMPSLAFRAAYYSPFITLAFVCTLSFLAIISVTLKAGGVDDAYITYTFARNLAEGGGFVYFEGGPRVYGSTTLTYTLLLALAHSVGLPIPVASMLLGAFFWAVSLVPLYICIRKLCTFSSRVSSEVVPLVGVTVAGLCIVPAFFSLGLETGLYCLLAFSSFALYATGRVELSLFMAGLTALTRLDGLLVGVIVGAHLLVSSGSLKEGLKTALRRGWIALLLLFISTLFLWWYFGNPLPQTFLAKTSFPETVSGRFELSRYRELFGGGLGELSFYVTGGFAAVAIFLASRVPGFRNSAFVMCAWVVLYPLMFKVAGIPHHGWYYVPILPALLALAAVGAYQLGVLWHTSDFRERSTRMYMPPLLLSAFLLLGLSYDAERWWTRFEAVPWGEGIKESVTYRLAQAIVEDIRERGIENPDVMAYEIGHLGWQVGEIPGARVHDMLGLTSPEVYGNNGEWKPQNLLKYDPEYIMIRQQPGYRVVSWLYRSGILENRYGRIASVEGGPVPYLAFVRTELLELPPPLSKLSPVDATTKSKVDKINGIPVEQREQAVTISQEARSITVTGWAVDARSKEAAGGVYIDVDSKLFPAYYGLERKDVAQALQDPAYRATGFRRSIRVSETGRGMHKLSIVVLTSDREKYYRPLQEIVFEVGS